MFISEFPDELYDVLERLDQRTFRHCLRVSRLCEAAEGYLDMDNRLSMAGKIHDIGKIYFSESMNNKEGVFTDIEKRIMSLHPFLGYALLKDYDINEDVQQIVLLHHGTSPPHIGTLKLEVSDEIKEYANVLHTIDTYEALVSPRSYRKKTMSIDEALDILKKEEYANPKVISLIEQRLLNI